IFRLVSVDPPGLPRSQSRAQALHLPSAPVAAPLRILEPQARRIRVRPPPSSWAFRRRVKREVKVLQNSLERKLPTRGNTSSYIQLRVRSPMARIRVAQHFFGCPA